MTTTGVDHDGSGDPCARSSIFTVNVSPATFSKWKLPATSPGKEFCSQEAIRLQSVLCAFRGVLKERGRLPFSIVREILHQVRF